MNLPINALYNGKLNNLNSKFYRSYLYICFLGYVISLVGLILMHAQISTLAAHAFKFGFLLSAGITILSICVNGLKIDLTNAFFIVAGLWGLALGLFQNRLLDKAFYSHIFGAVLPIAGIHFGGIIARFADKQPLFPSKRLVRGFIYIHGLLLIIYYVFYKIEIINYFGVSSNLFTFFAFTLARGDVFGSVLAVIFTFFSGKRTVLLAICITLVFYLYFIRKKDLPYAKVRQHVKLYKASILIFIVLLSILAAKLGMLDRFISIINVDFSNPDSLYVATSGRSFEAEHLFASISKNPLLWWTGGGFGVYFTMPIGLHETETFNLHYSHFSPFYIVMVYGIPLAVIYYGILVSYLFRARKFVHNPFVLLAFTGFALSFAGCNLLVDINFWCCFGAAKCLVDQSRSTISQKSRLMNLQHVN